MVIITGATLWAVATLYTGFATGTLLLAAVLVLDGLSTGSANTLTQPLLMDSYPPPARVRVFSYITAINNFGNVLAPLLVALLAGVLGFTWRGVFLVFGIMCLAVLPLPLRLRDPGFGKFDTERVRSAVHEIGDDLAEDDVSLGFFEITRRLFLIPTVRKLLTAFAIFGMLLIPFTTFLSVYLDETLDFGAGQRGLFFALTSVASMVALAVYGKRGEAMFRKNPGRVLDVAGLQLAVGVVLICLAVVSPWVWLTLLLFTLSTAIDRCPWTCHGHRAPVDRAGQHAAARRRPVRHLPRWRRRRRRRCAARWGAEPLRHCWSAGQPAAARGPRSAHAASAPPRSCSETWTG